MKQKIFTLMILLALVVAGGKAFGQGKFAPYLGSTHNYTMDLDNNVGDAYLYTVSNSDDDYDPANDGVATIVPVGAAIPATGEATAAVTWTQTGVFNLWLQVADDTGTPHSGCSNRRFIEITVTNPFNVAIYALGASHDTEYSGWSGNTGNTSTCPSFESPNFAAGASASDGSSQVFFRVARLQTNGTYSWYFSVTGDISNIQYYIAGSWTSTAPSSGSPLASTVTEVLVRGTITNVPAGISDVDGDVVAYEIISGSGVTEVAANLTDNNDAIDISSIPNMGTTTFQ
jgi:hypothetical protein